MLKTCWKSPPWDHWLRRSCCFFQCFYQGAWEELSLGPLEGSCRRRKPLISQLLAKSLQGTVQVWQLEGCSYSAPCQLWGNCCSVHSWRTAVVGGGTVYQSAGLGTQGGKHTSAQGLWVLPSSSDRRTIFLLPASSALEKKSLKLLALLLDTSV